MLECSWGLQFHGANLKSFPKQLHCVLHEKITATLQQRGAVFMVLE
jgi:hypothetical protein